MLGHRTYLTIGLLAGLLMAGSAMAAPSVITLGGDSSGDDPIAACGDLAASPWEAGRDGRGLEDDQVFIDGAITACEAALAADPQSADAQTWLARAYVLAGRRTDAMPLLQSASDAGNAFASYLLSGLLGRELDRTVAQDPERAATLLQQAADGGFAPAQSDLAERYEMGNGVPGDYAQAQIFYLLASKQGYGFATYKLGLFEHLGYLAEADLGRAMELYQAAADAGEPLGNYGLGQLYEFGQGVDQDYAKAAEYYQLAADKGEKMAQTGLAYFYEQGLGVPQDYDKSFVLLVSASGQGWGFAHAALSIHYLFGEGTPVDANKAYDLAWAAQREGVVYAEGILGYMFQNGLGTNRDLSSALFHYQDGANGGDQYSADQIPAVEAELACQDAAGSPYEPAGFGHGKAFLDIDAEAAISACESALTFNQGSVGDGVWLGRAYARAERFEDAVPLLEQGVNAGNLLAHTVLGDLLMTGSGIERDPQRALQLYNAVAKDFGLAQYTLGLLYAEGHEVPQDRDEALRWLRLAQSFGVTEADAEIAALMNEDSSEAETVDLTGFGKEGPTY
jgi:TPR repeat protein